MMKCSALDAPLYGSSIPAVTRFSRTRLWVVALFMLGLLPVNGQATTQVCPPVGSDTTCGVIITINQAVPPCPPQGCTSIVLTGQGPFDDIEDSLVGVVNNSGVPITSLELTSALFDIFGFDDDGICATDPNGIGHPYIPAPPACPYGPTGYEGPGTSFSNISLDAMSGTVNFNPPIAPGGTAYFSLEDTLSLTTTPCSDAINSAIPRPVPNGSPTINATFTPIQVDANSPTLAYAASLCGFSGWDWQQVITRLPAPSPIIAAGGTTPLIAPPSFLDPQPNGYKNLAVDHSYPFYFDPNSGELQAQEPGGLILNFKDTPADQCLPGGTGAPCGGNTAPAGSKLAFTTHLVGLMGQGPSYGVLDTGIGFSWVSTFNGTSGGTSVTKNLLPPDSGSGTGGITITKFNDTTGYQFPKGVGVAAINGVSVGGTTVSTTTLLEKGQAAVTATGLAYSRVTQTFDGSVTLTNTSASTIVGPFQIVFDSLTSGVTLVNSGTTFGGWPYLSLTTAGNLAPGAGASVIVQFSDPSNLTTNFSPIPYAGSFN